MLALLAVLLGAEPPLTVGERAHFAAPLIEATRVVLGALSKQGIACTPRTATENWVGPEAREGAPSFWGVIFDCESTRGRKQLAVHLLAQAAVVPRHLVLSSGPGFALRQLDGTYRVLAVGSLLVFDTEDQRMPPSRPGPSDIPPRAVWVVSAETEWLRALPIDELLGVLARAKPVPSHLQLQRTLLKAGEELGEVARRVSGSP